MENDFLTKWNKRYNSEFLIPVIVDKGMSDVLKNFDRAKNDLYSRAVFKIRQSIESLFNWLIEKAVI